MLLPPHPTFAVRFIIILIGVFRSHTPPCAHGAVPLAAGRRYAGVWPEPMNIPVLIDTAIPPQYVANIDAAVANINQQIGGGNCVRLSRITTRPTTTFGIGQQQPTPPVQLQAGGVTTATTTMASAANSVKPYMYFTGSKVHYDRDNPGNTGGTTTTAFPPFAVTAATVCDTFVGVDLRSQKMTPGEQVVTVLWDATAGRNACLRDGPNGNNNNVRVIMALIVKSLGLFPEISRTDRLPRVQIQATSNAAIMQLYGDPAAAGAGFDMGPFDCNSITMPDPLLYSADGTTPWWTPQAGECPALSTALLGAVTQISQRDCIAIAFLMFRRSPGCGTNLDDIVARCARALPSTT